MSAVLGHGVRAVVYCAVTYHTDCTALHGHRTVWYRTVLYHTVLLYMDMESVL